MSPVNYDNLTMEDLFQQHVEQQDIENLPEPSQSGGAFLSHPTGGYRIQAETVGVEKLALDDLYNPGRTRGHIQAAIMQKDGTPLKGKVFFDVSHEPKPHPTKPTTKDGKPRYDSAYTLFLQAAKALGVEKEAVGSIYEALAQYPLDAFITEDFWVKDSKPREYLKPVTPVDYENCRVKVKSGEYATRNSVRTLSKIKE